MKIPHAAYLLVLMWLVHAAQLLFTVNFNSFGILPRELSGLIGILFAPWLHGGWWHLIGNSFPFLILGALIQLKNTEIFWESTLIITIVAGFGTWLFGSATYHIGASGLALGYWSFILADAFFSRSIKAILLASITLVMYGSFIFIVLDFRPHISWSGHLSGILAGILVAKLYFNSLNKTECQDHMQ